MCAMMRIRILPPIPSTMRPISAPRVSQYFSPPSPSPSIGRTSTVVNHPYELARHAFRSICFSNYPATPTVQELV